MIDPTDTKTGDLVAMQEARQQIAQVVQQYGDNAPYSYERVMTEAAFFLEQSATAAIELGKRLILLKEMEGHGNFGKALEQLGLSTRTAQKVMSSVLKLPNAPTSAHLTQMVKSRSKLFELMVLDEGELKELSEGGTVANLKLDDVDRMSVRELRAALRSSRDDLKAKDNVLAGKNQKLDEMEGTIDKLSRKLTERQGLLSTATPDQEAKRLRSEVESVVAMCQIDLLTRDIPAAFRQLMAHSERTGINHDDHMRGWLASLQRQLDMVRDEFGIFGEAGMQGAYWEDEVLEAEATEATERLTEEWNHGQASH